jgi:hypothetical protein
MGRYQLKIIRQIVVRPTVPMGCSKVFCAPAGFPPPEFLRYLSKENGVDLCNSNPASKLFIEIIDVHPIAYFPAPLSNSPSAS